MKEKIKNPKFWAQIIVSIFIPILSTLGINWDEVTTWNCFFNLLIEAVSNPVVVVAVIVSVWNAIYNPTKGNNNE